MPHPRTGRRSAALVAVASITTALAACAAPTAMPAPIPSYSPSYVPAPVTALAPLTGAAVDARDVDHPALAAKIDNHRLARPQVGLERADLVFEELVEGGLTRYVAVWHSDVPEEIGPVRSIRPMDPDIVSPLGGIVAYSGGQYRFVQLMQSAPVYNAIHGQPDTADLMYRTSAKSAPHNVLVKAQTLVERHDDLVAPAQQFAFAPDVASSTAFREGEPAGSVVVRFGAESVPSWDWDAASASWLRSQGGTPDLDAAGDRLSARNVVVLRVPISHDLGVPKTELIGAGEAWVLSGGRWIAASWEKSSATAPILLSDATGTTVRLAPGNSWIELMPGTGEITVTSPSGS